MKITVKYDMTLSVLKVVRHVVRTCFRSSLKIRNWKRFQTNESRQGWRKNVYMIVNSCFCTTSMYYCTWIYYRNKISVVTINLPFNNEIGWLQHSDSPSDVQWLWEGHPCCMHADYLPSLCFWYSHSYHAYWMNKLFKTPDLNTHIWSVNILNFE